MSGAGATVRKATPRGQMTRGANTGPAVMLMPPEIRSTFMPNPPLQPVPVTNYRRKQKWTGVSNYMVNLETTPAPERILMPTPKSIKEKQKLYKQEQYRKQLEPVIAGYRNEQRDCGGEYEGMNCYNTLFVGRLAYEVTERKLLREMEVFGPVKDIKIVYDTTSNNKKSRGYAFVEYEHEEDMKRAYRAADGMRIEGREIVADVERGHTVPTWLPRRLGGGLGGTRLGGRDVNVTRPGRFDPSRPTQQQQQSMMMGGPPPPPSDMHYPPQPPPMDYGGGGGDRNRVGPPPSSSYGGGGGYGGSSRGGPPPGYGGGGGSSRGGGSGGGHYGSGGGSGPPPPRSGGDMWGGDRGGGGSSGGHYRSSSDRDGRKRQRSRSPDPGRYGGGGGGHRRR